MNTTLLVQRCIECGCEYQYEVQTESLESYKRGALVQVAFPLMLPEWREFFFCSHLCPNCWTKLFDESEDECEYEDELQHNADEFFKFAIEKEFNLSDSDWVELDMCASMARSPKIIVEKLNEHFSK